MVELVKKISEIMTILWVEVLGPMYAGALYYISQLTAIDEGTIDLFVMSMLILAGITVFTHFLPESIKGAMNWTAEGTYDKSMFSFVLWIWFEINIRLGTRTFIVYLFGASNYFIAGPTSWVISLLPSICQAFFTHRPSKNKFDQQFEKTLFMLDLVATTFGLALNYGWTPEQFVQAALGGHPMVIVLCLFSVGGNFWAENTLHEMAMGGRSLVKKGGGSPISMPMDSNPDWLT